MRYFKKPPSNKLFRAPRWFHYIQVQLCARSGRLLLYMYACDYCTNVGCRMHPVSYMSLELPHWSEYLFIDICFALIATVLKKPALHFLVRLHIWFWQFRLPYLFVYRSIALFFLSCSLELKIKIFHLTATLQNWSQPMWVNTVVLSLVSFGYRKAKEYVAYVKHSVLLLHNNNVCCFNILFRGSALPIQLS